MKIPNIFIETDKKLSFGIFQVSDANSVLIKKFMEFGKMLFWNKSEVVVNFEGFSLNCFSSKCAHCFWYPDLEIVWVSFLRV